MAELRSRLSSQEFTYWGIYYARKAQQQELAQKYARGEGRR